MCGGKELLQEKASYLEYLITLQEMQLPLLCRIQLVNAVGVWICVSKTAQYLQLAFFSLILIPLQHFAVVTFAGKLLPH